jgi:hypothetical protein
VAYTIPRYIATADIDTRELRFRWDDWKASGDFEYIPDRVVDTLMGVTLRARIAAAIGMYEWIIWRFYSVLDDPTPFLLAEAAWCANVRRDYMEYTELDRYEWLGPVRGPLWCAVTWLLPMIFFSDEDPTESESGLAYLSSLAVHVVPVPTVFEEWLDACTKRLVALYPAPEEDPFEDLFGQREEERRGALVAREVLDPDFDYRPEMARQLMSIYLRDVDHTRNPYLHSPEEMVSRSFKGIPYHL